MVTCPHWCGDLDLKLHAIESIKGKSSLEKELFLSINNIYKLTSLRLVLIKIMYQSI